MLLSTGYGQKTKETETDSFPTYRAEQIYDDYNNFRAIIHNTGVVRWEPGGVFKTMCQIDITFYPFDEQVSVLGKYEHVLWKLFTSFLEGLIIIENPMTCHDKINQSP